MFHDSIDPATTSQEWYTPPYIFDALCCRFENGGSRAGFSCDLGFPFGAICAIG